MEELGLTEEQIAQRDEQDERWKDADIDGRAHVSHRELAMAHRGQFKKAIGDFNTVEAIMFMHMNDERPWCDFSLGVIEHIMSYTMWGNDQLVFESARRRRLYGLFKLSERYLSSNFRICVRKRPLLDFEIADGEYDVVHTCKRSVKDDEDNAQSLCLHDGKLSRNGRRLSMVHRSYVAHEVWPQASSNAEVCESAVSPLLESCRKGVSATMIMFGQTGTGKTYTLNAALDYLADALDGTCVHVSLYEIHGKKSYDLMNERCPVMLRTDSEGKVHARGATMAKCTTAEETRECIKRAIDLRSSRVTERNPISSRSHAVCLIRIPRHHDDCSEGDSEDEDDDFDDGEGDGGGAWPSSFATLTLVDLAGSERNYETTQMTAAQHKESADINFSLMALKDCFRAFHDRERRLRRSAVSSRHSGSRIPSQSSDDSSQGAGVADAAGVAEAGGNSDGMQASAEGTSASAKRADRRTPPRINFRAHLLTRVLQDCFVEKDHKTSIVVTLSPTPTDLYHSLNSLEHALKMCPELYKAVREVTCEIPLADMPSNFVPVTEWTCVQVQAWLANTDNGRFAALALPQNLDGKTLMSLDRGELSALFAGELRRARIEEEGAAWVVQSSVGQTAIGEAFWAALHREQRTALALAAAAENADTDKVLGALGVGGGGVKSTSSLQAPMSSIPPTRPAPPRRVPISLAAALRKKDEGGK